VIDPGAASIAKAVDHRLAVRRSSPVLRDAPLDEHLALHGYVVLGSLLDDERVAGLARIYQEEVLPAWEGREPDRWLSTLMVDDASLSLRISDLVEELVWPVLSPAFLEGSVDYVLGDLSIKPPGPDTELGAHQDYSLVDEDEFRSLYFWSPLTQASVANGALHVVPGSHLYGRAVRSVTVRTHFMEVEGEIEALTVPLRLAAGEVVVTDGALVHHSPPNLTATTRLATHGSLASAGAPLTLFHRPEPDGDVELYEVSEHEYPSLIISLSKPGGRRLRTVPSDPDGLSPEELAGGLARYRSLVSARAG